MAKICRSDSTEPKSTELLCSVLKARPSYLRVIVMIAPAGYNAGRPPFERACSTLGKRIEVIADPDFGGKSAKVG